MILDLSQIGKCILSFLHGCVFHHLRTLGVGVCVSEVFAILVHI